MPKTKMTGNKCDHALPIINARSVWDVVSVLYHPSYKMLAKLMGVGLGALKCTTKGSVFHVHLPHLL